MYFVKDNKLYYSNNGDSELSIKRPTIVYDSEDNLLLKHGDKQDVELWYAVAYNAYLIVNHKMASNLRIVELNVSAEKAAEFLNTAISINGCIDKQLVDISFVINQLCK